MNLLAALGLTVAAMAAGCTPHAADGNLQVIHLPLSDEVKSLDPANAYDSVSLDVLPNICESLYQYAYLSDTVRVVPLLAADQPKYSRDRLTLLIPIQKGIRFANDDAFPGGKGRELTAQDFVYSLKRLALPSLQSQGWWILDGKIAGINAFHDKLVKANKGDLDKAFNEPVEGIQAPDRYTLRLKLVKPYPQLMYILTLGFTAAVPREAVAAYGDENGNLTDHPVGTGPYTLSRWERGHELVLDRNPNYHPVFYPTRASPDYRRLGMLADAGKKLPFADRLDFRVEKESQPRWLNFMTGKLDAITIPKDNLPEAIQGKTRLSAEMVARGMRLTIESGQTFYYISFNMKDKVIGTNKYLRQALSSAIDRDLWISTFTDNTGLKMVNALPPGVPGRPSGSAIRYDYNLARARELLQKAGYPGGQGLPILNFDMRGADTLNRQLGDFMSREFAAIGVQLNVIYNTFPAYLEKAKEGNLQISLGGWNMDYPDAENVFQLLYGPNQSPGPNDSNYDNPEMNQLYERMAVMENSPARARIIQRMDSILQEDCPWALGYYYSQYDLSQPWLMNYRPGTVIQNREKYFRVDQSIRERKLSGAS